MLEQEWTEEPRRLAEILETMDLLVNQVWYSRHQLLVQGVEEGRIEIVEKSPCPEKSISFLNNALF